MDDLFKLDQMGIDLVISYTCLGNHREGYDDTGPEGLSDEQIDAWIHWTQNGGKILAVHSATVLGNSNIRLAELLGGQFINHPPQFNFTVYPMAKAHPITNSINAFCILDEFYIQKPGEDIDIHMVAIDRGFTYPMVWSKMEGHGRVVHLAPGHSPEVWYHPEFKKLTINAVDWLFQED